MVKQEDEYAKQNNTQYPRSAEYDVTLPESPIRIKMADGLPDFFIGIDLAIAGSFLLRIPRIPTYLHTYLPTRAPSMLQLRRPGSRFMIPKADCLP